MLCRGSIRRCPVDAFAEAAATAGFVGVSLYYDDLGGDPRRVRKLLDDHGLAVAELDGASRWLRGDDRGPSIAEMLDAAAELRARSVTILQMRGLAGGRSLSWYELADAFGRVCDRGATLGLLAHLEFFPTSGINTFAAAANVVALADRPNGGVLLDTWHYLRGADAGRWPAGVPGAAVSGSSGGRRAAGTRASIFGGLSRTCGAPMLERGEGASFSEACSGEEGSLQ